MTNYDDERAERTRTALAAARVAFRASPEVKDTVLQKVDELEALRERMPAGPEFWLEEGRITGEIKAIMGNVDDQPIPEYATELARDLKGSSAAQDDARLQDDQRRARIGEANQDFGVVPKVDLIRPVETENTFARFQALPQLRQAIEATKQWASLQRYPILVLAGTPGNGKTHLCEAAAMYHQEQTRGVRLTTQGDMMAHIKGAFGRNADDIIDAYKTTRILILDELGLTALSPAMSDILDQIIDSRWKFAGALLTMVATNLLGKDFRDKGLARVESRLSDATRSRTITIEAGDYRKRER